MPPSCSGSACRCARSLAPSRTDTRGGGGCSLQIHHEGKAVSPVSGLSDRMFMAGIEAPGSGTWRGLDLVAAGIHSIGHLFDALD
jgi:hypothetical protein